MIVLHENDGEFGVVETRCYSHAGKLNFRAGTPTMTSHDKTNLLSELIACLATSLVDDELKTTS